ncbi:MAG: protein kinase [Deltaproteobacteria bacterium]|nr:protein kinase [Deltaproteobacteria bacterium]
MGCPDESALLDFARGQLPDDQAQAIEAHIDGCADCRALVADAARQDDPSSADGLPRGAPEPADGGFTRLGRYAVLELIGGGGMGVVYEAFDPELERKVALKVLRPEALGGESATQAQGRLLREAQSMAKLAHPHVAAVFDVGAVGEQVFLAMELVDGGTLGDWMAEARRSWRDVVQVFLDAGKGLAAAHAAGLVHRDFKPSNVLIGRDGRVRVTDFGLARVAAREQEGMLGSTHALPLPRRGEESAAAGTPAYMAPEQLQGGTADARSDQYSFCVALWEALYGERPFGGKTLEEHAQQVLSGKPRPPPPETSVPAWLQRVLERGLSVAPERRFPFFESLLEALGRSRRGEKLVRWGLAAGAALVLASLVAAVQLGRAREGRCAEAGSEITQIWSTQRSAQVRQAFESAKARPRDFVRLDQAVRGYVEGWQSAARRLCASKAGASGNAAGAATREACLAERQIGIAALVNALREVDDRGVARAGEAVSQLEVPESCLTLAEAVAPIGLGASSVAGLEIARQIADAEALRLLGRQKESDRQAEQALKAARGAGLRGQEGRAELVLGLSRGDLPLLHAAAASAEASHDSATAARAWIAIARKLGESRAEEAAWAAAHALAFCEVRGGLPAIEAQACTALAAWDPGSARAREYAQRAVVLADGTSLSWLQVEARAARAGVALAQDRRAQAREDVAAVDREADPGLSDPLTAALLGNLARMLRSSGEPADARKLLDRVLRIRVLASGEQSEEALQALVELAGADLEADQPEEAARRARRARDLVGDSSALGREAALLEAEGLRRQERCEEAVPLYQAALTGLPEKRAKVALGQAACLLELGHAAKARVTLEAALSQVEPGQSGPLRFALGRSLWAEGSVARARREVERAVGELSEGSATRAEAERWLQEQGAQARQLP